MKSRLASLLNSKLFIIFVIEFGAFALGLFGNILAGEIYTEGEIKLKVIFNTPTSLYIILCFAIVMLCNYGLIRIDRNEKQRTEALTEKQSKARLRGRLVDPIAENLIEKIKQDKRIEAVEAKKVFDKLLGEE